MGPPNDVTPSLRKTRKTSPGEPRAMPFSAAVSRLIAFPSAGKDSPINSPVVRSFPLLAIWNDFAKQFSCLHSRQFDRPAAETGCPIIFSRCPPLALDARNQVALLLQSVQQRIKRSRAQSIAVPGQLFDHPLAVQFCFGGMMQDMQANEAAEEIAMIHFGKMPRL